MEPNFCTKYNGDADNPCEITIRLEKRNYSFKIKEGKVIHHTPATLKKKNKEQRDEYDLAYHKVVEHYINRRSFFEEFSRI